MRLENVVLPSLANQGPWDIVVEDGILKSIERTEYCLGVPGLLLPALCHPHIHLDKAYISTRNLADTDLLPHSGSFSEALQKTSQAKERYGSTDLLYRGSQLLATSYLFGVTDARVFVEVDHVTELLTLAAAVKLKEDFASYLNLQICVFAQDPIFSTEHGDMNRKLIETVMATHRGHIEVLGTAPYVEEGIGEQEQNIEWAIRKAIVWGVHLDLHLDYNIDSAARSLLPTVISLLIKYKWPSTKTVVLGHCTKLTTYEDLGLGAIVQKIQEHNLPIFFVGLPTSDLYMMGRPQSPSNIGPEGSQREQQPHSRPRGTMQIPAMIKDYGFKCCLGVNNVGNPFTPFGTGDPLQLASWGLVCTMLAQFGTRSFYMDVSAGEQDRQSVSGRTKQAQSNGTGRSVPSLGSGSRETDALVREQGIYRAAGSEWQAWNALANTGRQRLSIQDVVWDPPESTCRKVV